MEYGVPMKVYPFAVVLLCACFFVFSPTASAQVMTGALLGDADVSLASQPSFPTPFSEVVVSLEAYSLNTVGSTILWYVDGKEYTQGKNERSIMVTTGGLGSVSKFRAVMYGADGTKHEASLTVPITQVDVIVEASTSVPFFYKGRPLPAARGGLRAVAVIHGGRGGRDEYSYDWRLDNNPLFGGPVRSKQFATFILPPYGSRTLTVLVYDTEGRVVGRGAIEVRGSEPELIFYEETALRGARIKAVENDFTLIGDETTIVAAPYFINTIDGVYDWFLNGSPVDAPKERPNALTLRHVEGEGMAEIECKYTSSSPIPQQTAGSFNLFFK